MKYHRFPGTPHKGTISVISSYPLCKDGMTDSQRYPLNLYLINNVKYVVVFKLSEMLHSDNSDICFLHGTVVSDYFNQMKTTFDLNFDLYQAFKQHGYTKTWKQRKAVNYKSFSLITCELVFRKKLVNN